MSYQLPSTAYSAETPIEKSAYRKINLRITAVLAFCFVLAWMDRANLSFARLKMQSDISLGEAAYGFGVGIFFVGYFLLEIPSNILLTRIGARKTISRIMLLWGVASACTMLVQTPMHFYIARFALGLAEAGFFPGAMLVFTYWFPAKRRARVIALFALALPMAGFVGGPLSTIIIQTFEGIGGLKGWQWMFMIEGLPTIVTGIWVYYFFTDSPREAHWLTAQEKAVVIGALDREQQNKGFDDSTHRFLPALKNPGMYITAFVYFTVAWAATVLNFWGPSIIRTAGATSMVGVGFLTAIPWFVGAVGMLIVCRSSDRRLERRWHWAIAAIVTAASVMSLGMVQHNLVYVIISMSIMTVGYLSISALFFTIPAAFLSGTAAAGGLALISSMGQIGGFISPIVLGNIKESSGSLEYGLYAVAFMLFLGAMTVLLLIPKDKLKEIPQEESPVPHQGMVEVG